MNVQQILALDIEDIKKLKEENPSAMRKMIRQLQAAAKKRIQRQKKASKVLNPVTSKFINSTALVSIKGKSDNEAMAKFTGLRQYLTNSYSTAKGNKFFLSDFREKSHLPESDISDADLGAVLSALGKLEDKYGDFMKVYYPSDVILGDLVDLVTTGKLKDGLLDNVDFVDLEGLSDTERTDKLYEIFDEVLGNRQSQNDGSVENAFNAYHKFNAARSSKRQRGANRSKKSRRRK